MITSDGVDMLPRVLLFLFLLVSVVFPLTSQAQQTILGVLEEVPGNYVGEANWNGVRVLFKKSAAMWSAFPSDCPNQKCLKTISKEFPPETTWTISFDGKSLGQVTARTPDEFSFYSQIGLQIVPAGASIPTVGKPSPDFSGFLGTPVHRPLVADSQPYFKDPDLWKPAALTPEFLALVRQQFRSRYPRLCRSTKEDETKLEPYPYGNDEVQLVKAYAAKSGWFIVRLHLAGAVECKDEESGFEMEDPWFTVDPTHSAEYLDSGIWLVDAGDYDNDGKAELLFSISRYNRGGYVLYYDEFNKHVAFEFSFH